MNILVNFAEITEFFEMVVSSGISVEGKKEIGNWVIGIYSYRVMKTNYKNRLVQYLRYMLFLLTIIPLIHLYQNQSLFSK